MADARSPPSRRPSSWPSSATGLTRLPAIVFELPVTEPTTQQRALRARLSSGISSCTRWEGFGVGAMPGRGGGGCGR